MKGEGAAHRLATHKYLLVAGAHLPVPMFGDLEPLLVRDPLEIFRVRAVPWQQRYPDTVSLFGKMGGEVATLVRRAGKTVKKKNAKLALIDKNRHGAGHYFPGSLRVG